MVKNRQKKVERNPENITLSDSLNEDILTKLQAAKKELSILEKEKENERQEKLRKERKQREKNKTFEELLEEYGDNGSKY